MRIYFDTNIFINIASGEIEKTTYEILKQCLVHNNISAYYTPITFDEVVANINFSNRAIFHRYTKILSTIKDLCGDNIFEYPAHAITKYIWNLPNRNLNAVEDLNRYRDFICRHASYQELRRTENFKRCRKMIGSHLRFKRKWVRSVNKFMNGVNPDFKQKRKHGKSTRIINGKKRKELLDSLFNQAQKSRWIDATIQKSTPVPGEALIGTPNKQMVRKFYNKLSAYFKAYEEIGEKVINDGYVIKENDYNDFHLLVYLGKSDSIMLISQDAKLQGMIAGCSQSKQVINLHNFISLYCAAM